MLDLVNRILADQLDDPAPTRLIEHKIRTSSDEPVRHKQRRMSPKVREQALRIVKKLRKDDVMEPSDLYYSSAPVMMRKSDGTYRICIDYRDVNARMIEDAYPTPSADAIRDGLRGARYISKINRKQAFLQVAIAVPKLWQFRRMPFGLYGSPVTFRRLVDSLFEPEC